MGQTKRYYTPVEFDAHGVLNWPDCPDKMRYRIVNVAGKFWPQYWDDTTHKWAFISRSAHYKGTSRRFSTPRNALYNYRGAVEVHAKFPELTVAQAFTRWDRIKHILFQTRKAQGEITPHPHVGAPLGPVEIGEIPDMPETPANASVAPATDVPNVKRRDLVGHEDLALILEKARDALRVVNGSEYSDDMVSAMVDAMRALDWILQPAVKTILVVKRKYERGV